MKLLTDNPLIERYRFSSLRPKQCYVYGSIFTVIVFILFMVNLAAYFEAAAFGSITEMFSSLYYQLYFLLFVVACIFSASSTATALRDEFVERSYDFFRMLPLSAHYKATGIMIGRNLLTFIIAGVLATVVMFTGILGGISPLLIIQMLFCAGSIAVLFNLMGLFSSINPNRKITTRQGQSSGPVLTILLVIPCLVIMLIISDDLSSWDQLMVSFFGIEVPILFLIAVLALYLSIWLYLGICRKFDREGEPVMTKSGAIFFLLGAMTILLGLLGPHMDGPEYSDAVPAFWIVSFLIAVLLPPGFCLTRQRYMEVRSLNSELPMREFLLRHSNLSVCVALYLIWAVFALGTALYAPSSIVNPAIHLLNLFTFYLVFCLLIEISQVADAANSRLRVLLAFLGILFIFLPLIVAATLSSGGAAVFSLFGYFFFIAERESLSDIPAASIVSVLNLCFIAVLGVIVRQAYDSLFGSKVSSADTQS